MEVEKTALYEVRAMVPATILKAGKIRVSLGPVGVEAPFDKGGVEVLVGQLRLPAGPGRVESVVDAGEQSGAQLISIRRVS